MTAPPRPGPTASKGGRPRAVVAAIVVVVLIALVGGVFLVDELTTDDDTSNPPSRVAQRAVAAIGARDDRTLRGLSTGAGTAQLLAMDLGDVDGLTITAASCSTVAAPTPTRVCTASRPGGQLQLRLIRTDDTWKVAGATVGPAGLPPTSAP
jgi:hypothetical protein